MTMMRGASEDVLGWLAEMLGARRHTHTQECFFGGLCSTDQSYYSLSMRLCRMCEVPRTFWTVRVSYLVKRY